MTRYMPVSGTRDEGETRIEKLNKTEIVIDTPSNYYSPRRPSVKGRKYEMDVTTQTCSAKEKK